MKYIDEFYQNSQMGYAVHRLIYDLEGNAMDYEFIDVNDSALKMMDTTRDDIIGKTVLEWNPNIEREWIYRYASVVETGKPISFSMTDTSLGRSFSITASKVGDELFACNYLDKTNIQRKKEQNQIWTSRMSAILEKTSDMIAHLDNNLNYIYVNDKYCEFKNKSYNELINQDIYRHLDWGHQKEFHETYQKMIEEDESQRIMTVYTDKAFHQYIEWHFSPVCDNEGFLNGMVLVGHDITNSQQENLKMKLLINYDSLTGLINRKHLIELAEEAINKYEWTAGIFIDIDNFKNINDLFGHAIGDEFLKSIAKVLEDRTPENAIISRLAGDEFFVFIPQYKKKMDVIDIVSEILNSISNVTTLALTEAVYVNASAGIAYYPEHTSTMEELISLADIAMIRAKTRGKNQYRTYREGYRDHSLNTFHFVQDIHRSLKNDEFTMVYQPVVDIDNMNVTQVEALMRWNHPKQGTLTPDKFMHIIEISGDIIEISYRMMHKMAKQIKQWEAAGMIINLSFNASPTQLELEGFSGKVINIFQQYEVNLHRLCIEITEKTLLSKTYVMEENVKQLRTAGIKIALDDFGIEYSTLAALEAIDFDVIKIDRYFTTKLDESFISQVVIEMIQKIINTMQKECTVEGVETTEQLEKIKSMGFNMIQGYYFSKPVCEKHIIDVIKNINQ